MYCRSVLIVDDDDRLQKMLGFFFVENDFTVMRAKDGFAAIKILETLRPDIILLDLAMPSMDGFEFVQKLKENMTWGEIPLIAISALSASEHKDKLFSLGVNDYFEKPFVVSELMDSLTKILDSKKNVFRCNSGKLNFKGGVL